jgi:DNA-binding transcriptional MerR regulator
METYLLTLGEVAKILACAPETLRRWHATKAEGKPQPVARAPHSGNRLYDPAEIVAYRAQLEQAGA